MSVVNYLKTCTFILLIRGFIQEYASRNVILRWIFRLCQMLQDMPSYTTLIMKLLWYLFILCIQPVLGVSFVFPALFTCMHVNAHTHAHACMHACINTYLTIPKFRAVFIFAVLIFAHPLHRQCNSSLLAYYFSPPARK